MLFFSPRTVLTLALAVQACAALVWAQALPPAVEAALARAKVPREALSVVLVKPDDVQAVPRLAHQAQVPVNPASLMKLVTTTAALDVLGPAFVWNTPVYLEGTLREGVLQGHLYIKGVGDPRLGVERLWQLLRRVRGLGVERVSGDIVLDRSAFEVAAQDPGGFDGEALRPYNASPDALLLNFKSMIFSFVPDRAAQVARVHMEPPLAGVNVPATVPLSAGECGDYRGALKAVFTEAQRIRLGGSYAASCGEKVWPVAAPDPERFAARVVAGMWQQVGGQLDGAVRYGAVPAALKPVLQHESSSLAEVVRDINKYSNNVMAEQVFLTLGLQQRGLGSNANARDAVLGWWAERLPGVAPPRLDNGSGLSREARVSALALARLLQWAWLSPLYPELAASLPLTGVDGTLKRSRAQASAHLKTGSLRDVAGIAGYVDGVQGQRWVLVAILNHANAQAARPALDALVEWSAKQP